jgi:hypothetical protein
MVDIPGISDKPGTINDFGAYVNALYIFAITVGALLAVLKLVAAGVKYMFSDIVTNKEAAKNDIRGALLGLLIVIGAVVILNTVNPNLTNVNLNLTDARVDTGDYLGDALRRLQDRVAACRADVNCRMESCTIGVIQDCRRWCESKPGGVWYPGVVYGGTCFYRLEGDDADRRQCEAQNKIWDRDNRRCLDRDDNVEMREFPCIGQVTGILVRFDCTSAERRCREANGIVSGRIQNDSKILCAIRTN